MTIVSSESAGFSRKKQKSPLINRLVGYSFVAYLLLVVAPYSGLGDYSARVEAEPSPIWLFLGLCAVAGAAAMHFAVNNGILRLHFGTSAQWLSAFFVWGVATSFFSVDPVKSFVSGGIGLGLTLIFAYSAKYSFERGVLAVGAFAYFVYLVALMVMLGVVFGKTVGGIQPNQFAKAGIVVMVLAVLAGHRWRNAAIVFAFACSVIATSRGGILFIGIFLAVYALPAARPITIVRWVVCGAAGIAAAWLFELLTGVRTLSIIYSDLLLVDSEVYGLGSGLTGRTGHWEVGALQILDRPIIGHGYNTRGGIEEQNLSIINAHQGYLNLILDTGLVGLLLFAGAVLSSVRTSLVAIKSTKDNHVARGFLAFVAAYLVLMFIDPFYMNLSFPLSIILIFLLSNDARRISALNATASPTFSR